MKFFALLLTCVLTVHAHAEKLTDAQMTAVKKKLEIVKQWAADAKLVELVKAANANPEGKSYTNDSWKELAILDANVTAFTKNEAANLLKKFKDETVTEAFLNTAEGTKIAFLSKPSNWTHKSSDKHKVPMTGKEWIMPEAEKDASTGFTQIQVAVPVLDGGKAIGSLVVGLAVGKL
jgi:hypothetical protein